MKSEIGRIRVYSKISDVIALSCFFWPSAHVGKMAMPADTISSSCDRSKAGRKGQSSLLTSPSLYQGKKLFTEESQQMSVPLHLSDNN